MLLDLLFPIRCLGCGELLLRDERPGGVCAPCGHTMHRVESPCCPRCATPREVPSGVDAVCRRCLTDPPRFDAVNACWVYDGAVSDAIRRAKASDDPSTLRALADVSTAWFDEQIHRWSDRTWLWPPSHPFDTRRRGWEPAATLARLLTASAQRSMTWSRSLKKVTRATKQALLDREARRESLKGAFEARVPISGAFVVFDDVMTTGATMDAVAGALLGAGAESVVGVVVARSV